MKFIKFLIVYEKIQFCLFYILKKLKIPTEDYISHFIMNNTHFLLLPLPTFFPYLFSQIEK